MSSATSTSRTELPEVTQSATGSMTRIRATIVLIVALAISMMVMMALPSLSKPFIMDEMEFPAVAQAIKETGQPVYYRGETLPKNVGLWHPPLYILWFALWQWIFSSSIEASRAFGLFNACMAIGFVALLVARRWRITDGWGALVLLFCGLLVAATSPLLIHGSILPDIDTQVLPLTITAFFVFMFELRRRLRDERIYWLCFVLLLALQFAAKLTTPLLLIPAFLVFEVVRLLSHTIVVRRRGGERGFRLLITSSVTGKQLGTAVVRPLIASAAGLLVLIVGWYFVAQVWGVSFSLPFTYLTQSTNNPVNFSGGQNVLITILLSAPENFTFLTQWVGYPLLAALFIMIVRELFAPAPGILEVWERMALYTFIILLMLMYIVLRPAPFLFPKYYPPFVPLLGLLAVDLLLTLRQPRMRAGGVLLFGGLVATYLLYVQLQPLTSGRDFILAYYTEWPKDPLVNAWMVIPLGLGVVVSLAFFAVLRKHFLTLLTIGCLAISVGWQIETLRHQAQASYSTTYYYGEDSLAEVTEELRNMLPDDVIVVAPKDLGSRLQDRWGYIELVPDPRPQLAMPDVHYLVMRTNDYYGNTIRDTPEVQAVLDSEWVIVADIKNFRIMQRK